MQYESKKKFILKDRDGDYVSKVSSTGMETVKLQFKFTKDRSKAKIFSYDDLFSKLATVSIGGEFAHGFSGGKAIEI